MAVDFQNFNREFELVVVTENISGGNLCPTLLICDSFKNKLR